MEVEAISGACMLIRREVFERVGRFSEDYFMYTEDLDLCYKARKSGLKNYYIPGAAIVHFGGSSSKQAASNFSCIMMRESIWRFLCRTRGDFYGLGYRCAMLLSAVGRLGLLLLFFPVQTLRGRRQRWMGSFPGVVCCSTVECASFSAGKKLRGGFNAKAQQMSGRWVGDEVMFASLSRQNSLRFVCDCQ